jgi:hypothetical protein
MWVSHTQDQRYFLALRLGRTLLGRAEAQPISILSRCQLPRPNCQRSEANRSGKTGIDQRSLADSEYPKKAIQLPTSETRKGSRLRVGRQAAGKICVFLAVLPVREARQGRGNAQAKCVCLPGVVPQRLGLCLRKPREAQRPRQSEWEGETGSPDAARDRVPVAGR